MPAENVLMEGKIERVGEQDSTCSFTAKGRRKVSETKAIPSFAEGLKYLLATLTQPEHGVIESLSQLDAVGFKVVHARGYSGVQMLSPEVIQAMRQYCFIFPAHNPPYIRAIEDFRKILPEVPLVGLFETTFHQSLPEVAHTYSIPYETARKFGIRRYGFHGASHRYLTERYAELINTQPEKVNIITCHLGGSSSITAVRNGKSFDTSFGFSTQSGIPGSTRAADIDPYIIPFLIKSGDFTLDQVCELLTQKAGLLGISGLSGDMRDLENAAANGNERAQLAIDIFVHQVKKYIGAYLSILPDAEAVVFAGGIGERSVQIRAKVCSNLEHLGICLDTGKNKACLADEKMIAKEDSPVKIWVIPTNEEIIVARRVYNLISESKG